MSSSCGQQVWQERAGLGKLGLGPDSVHLPGCRQAARSCADEQEECSGCTRTRQRPDMSSLRSEVCPVTRILSSPCREMRAGRLTTVMCPIVWSALSARKRSASALLALQGVMCRWLASSSPSGSICTARSVSAEQAFRRAYTGPASYAGRHMQMTGRPVALSFHLHQVSSL